MSEYQYYEFLAVDRPLTEGEMGELSGISTRADITPTSFINEYNWGDLKANPAKLLQRYFDVFVYVAIGVHIGSACGFPTMPWISKPPGNT